jgi:uncharacterized repeat protein (TIGR03803 family)
MSHTHFAFEGIGPKLVLVTAVLGLLFIATHGARAQTETVLYSFTGGADGGLPNGVIRDENGNLYGTTCCGGAYNSGTVFEVSPSGTETVLYSFTGGADGGYPGAGLVRHWNGNLYGTTEMGGLCHGCGTVFKVTASGTESVLYSFSLGADGGQPMASLVQDKNGNLYGTTYYGGAYGYGTVFKLARSGKETILYSFSGGADGSHPVARLVEDKSGNLFGTTPWGGSFNCAGGCGTVFEVTPSGTETVLYTFTGGTDGGGPWTDLTLDENGNLYGTTCCGGTYNSGTVFEVSPSGTETVLYSFTGGADGGYPGAGLVRHKNGRLYGTTRYGGNFHCAGGCGTVFEVTPSGTEVVLDSFTVGQYPNTDLVLAGRYLYGTTWEGGTQGFGEVFKMKR